ncbi:MAG: hypothetical protein ACI4MV_04410 [Christensenellales bacterium]
MSLLNIKVRSLKKYAIQVAVDGSPIKGKSDKTGNMIYTYSTDNAETKVEIFNVNELTFPLWWLWSIFYFFIGVFGIFDPGYGNNFFDVRCNFSVDTTRDANLQVKIGVSDNGTRSNIWQCDTCATPVENEFSKNELLQKRIKSNKILKVFLWIATIAIVVAITAIKVIK